MASELCKKGACVGPTPCVLRNPGCVRAVRVANSVFDQGQNQAKVEKKESVIHLKAIGRAFGSMSISCLLIFAASPRDAFAADERYPNRIIQLVLPQPAGGSVDSVARALAPHLSAQLGQ